MTQSIPCFGFGVTRHKRQWPRENRFEVGTVFLRLPMRQLFQKSSSAQEPRRLAYGLFGLNKPSLLGFADSDHFDRMASHGSALAALDRLLCSQGITSCTGTEAGEVWLHTFPRVMGYAFKPVSFWFCHDSAGLLRAVVVEVHNTFGEQHCYLLHRKDGTALKNGELVAASKAFHVSPFFPVRGEYQFSWFNHPLDRSIMRIDYLDVLHHPTDEDAITLSTSISGSHVPIGFASCWRVLLGYPFNAVMVVFRIHYQALKLWCKGARFYPLPTLPKINVTHSQ